MTNHEELRRLATDWRDYKLNNVANTAEHIGMLFVHKRNFERAVSPDAILALLADLDALRTRLAEVERDVARYRWLYDNCTRESDGGLIHIDYSCSFEHYGDPDASIDAAMKEQA